jgi:hypothetical protein
MALAYYINNANDLGMVRQTLTNNGRNHFVILLDDPMIDQAQVQAMAAQNVLIGSILLPDLNCFAFLQNGDRYNFEINYKMYLVKSDMTPAIDEFISIIAAKMLFEDIDFIFYQEGGDKIVNPLDPRAFTNVLFDVLRDFYGILIATFPQPPQASSIHQAYVGQIQNKAYAYGIYPLPQQPQQQMLFTPMWGDQR